jgi:hypothetical protein
MLTSFVARRANQRQPWNCVIMGIMGHLPRLPRTGCWSFTAYNSMIQMPLIWRLEPGWKACVLPILIEAFSESLFMYTYLLIVFSQLHLHFNEQRLMQSQDK